MIKKVWIDECRKSPMGRAITHVSAVTSSGGTSKQRLFLNIYAKSEEVVNGFDIAMIGLNLNDKEKPKNEGVCFLIRGTGTKVFPWVLRPRGQ